MIGAQFRQLPMFLTPNELSGMHSNDVKAPMTQWRDRVRDVDDPRHHDGDPSRYLRQMGRVVDAQGGISKPVHARPTESRDELIDGHHRSTVAMETNRMVPVVWHDSWHPDRVARSAFYGPTSDDMRAGV